MARIPGGSRNHSIVRVGCAALIGAALMGTGSWLLVAKGDAATRAGQATKYDRVTASGNVFYKVPPGYAAVRQKGGVIMVPRSDLARGEINGVLLLSDGFALDPPLRVRLKSGGKSAAVQAIAIAAGGVADDPDAKMSAPERVSDLRRDGYEQFVLSSAARDREAGKTRYTQYAVFLFGDTGERAEIVMRVAYGSPAKLDALSAGFGALLTSMEFRAAGAPPPARLAPALSANLSDITPKPASAPAQTSAKGGAKSNTGRGSCGVRYRQQCSYVGAGAFANYSCLPVPYTPPGCR